LAAGVASKSGLLRAACRAIKQKKPFATQVTSYRTGLTLQRRQPIRQFASLF
jgi:hypothetical protein